MRHLGCPGRRRVHVVIDRPRWACPGRSHPASLHVDEAESNPVSTPGRGAVALPRLLAVCLGRLLQAHVESFVSWLRIGGCSFANSNSFGFDDPQTISRRLRIEYEQRGFQQCDGVLDALRLRPQHPNARMIGRRLDADVGEIEVEGDEDSILRLGGGKHSRIGGASQLFVQNGMDVVTSASKQGFGVTR